MRQQGERPDALNTITLRLLGPVQIERGGEPVHGFESRKALALLCYLALHDHPLPRSHLVATFWGEKTEKRGRGNLRRALANLMSLLPECLHVERHTIGFCHQCWTDVKAFEALVTQREIESFTAAAALYRGELLAGLTLKDCPEFELWLAVERERWHRRVWDVLEHLISYHERHGNYKAALEYVDRLLKMEPWREEVHRRKMKLLARVGEYSAALVQYQICRRILADELEVEPSRETTALYERIRSARSSRHQNLPPQPTPFVGRERELQALRRLLADPECRLITLVGIGGAGKTRLALQAGTQSFPSFLHGVCFVPLTALPAPALLPSAVARALHLTVHGRDDVATQVLDYLRDKELLLILDGFEHLLDAVDWLTEVLKQAPDVKLLVTSRERLHLRWEWLVEVEGLAYPHGEGQPEPDAVLERYGAVRLFWEVARRANPHFSLQEELSDVLTICQLVDGIPLGLELAAAWTARFSCRHIAQEIQHNLNFLRTALRDVPDRHRSLRAAFDHSWALLTADEQRTFRQLAIFRGSFSQDAAVAVAGASPALLTALVDKSLVRRVGEGRYEVHELLRQYAEMHLHRALAEEKAVRDRHCAYYTDFLRDREAALERTASPQVLEEMSAELENIRAAWMWALEQAYFDVLDRTANALFLFFDWGSLYQEGESLFDCTTVALRAHPRAAEAGTERLLARLLIRQGVLARNVEAEKAQTLLEEGLALARKVGERWEEAFALNNLGILAGLRGDYDRQRALFRESLSLFRSLGDRSRMATLLNNLAVAERLVGNYDQARQLSLESLALSRAEDDRRSTARALQHLAILAHVRGAYDEARPFYQESLALYRETGDQQGVALTLGNLGDLAYRTGDHDEARQVLRESLALRRRINDQWGVALALNTLGGVERATGRLQAARQYLREAMRVSRALQSQALMLEVLVEWAQLLAAEGETAHAVEILALVAHHPATEGWTREIATQLLASFSSLLPAHVARAARERGLQARVEDLIVRFLSSGT